jgi:hypothetical protein
VISWVIRIFLVVAGSLAGWVVARDQPVFGLVQSLIVLMLLVLIVYVVAFWPDQWKHPFARLDLRTRKTKAAQRPS